MKILFVYSTSLRRRGYAFQAMNHVGCVDSIRMDQYVDFDDTKYDGLIYGPTSFECEWEALDERYRVAYPYIPRIDEKYHNFKGKKLLFDTRDLEDSDGFGRFHDPTIPRMKQTPNFEFMKKFNVIIPMARPVHQVLVEKGPGPKIIPLLYCCKVGGYSGIPFPTPIRQIVYDRLKFFNPYTERTKDRGAYCNLLRSAKISVVTSGYGVITKSHSEALAAGAVLFCNESIKDIKLLPFADLEDEVSYVSFNLDNLENKLSELMKDEERINRITNNGRMVFDMGYNPERTAIKIQEYFS